MKQWLYVTLLCCLAAFSSRAMAEEQPPLIPMEDFFRNAEIIGFTISPDGKKIAYQKPWERRMNIFVRDMETDAETRLTSFTDRDVPGYVWKGSDHVLFWRDKGGDENYHIWLAPIAGGEEEARDLTPFEGVKVRLIDRLRDDPNHILLSMNQNSPEVFDAYRCNLETGELEMIAENPGNILGWITDHDGKLRAAIKTPDGISFTFLYRSSEDEPFRELITTDFQDTFYPISFDFDNRHMFVASNISGPNGEKTDKIGIYMYDPETREVGDLVFMHPEVDVDGLVLSQKRKVPTFVTYTTDRVRYHFLDEDRKSLQEFLTEKLPGYEISVSSMDDDERRGVCAVWNDRNWGQYYFFDRQEGTVTHLADVAPWLKEDDLAPMQAISYPSRDGLTVHAYLTLPRGVEPKNLPLIVHPHGGPEARDAWGLDGQVQFMANRGAAVLQPNFRISTGYGREFWQAGFKQWGRKMQDDLTDGVKWLVDQGIVDPGRVGIYGASYGGYAALAGLTFTPEVYACGISYVGPSNLFTLLDSIPPYWRPFREKMYLTIGDPVKDKDLLEEVSPYFHADRIRAPLFVAQGANDPRVKKAESDQIVEAVKKHGVDVTYMVKDNEGHGFANEENRFDFYREMERFFAKHLGLRQAE